MKKKFLEDPDDSDRFGFREEYWQQAEALIKADEQRRRRRRFWFWLGGSGLALVLALGLWWSRSSGVPAPATDSWSTNSERPAAATDSALILAKNNGSGDSAANTFLENNPPRDAQAAPPAAENASTASTGNPVKNGTSAHAPASQNSRTDARTSALSGQATQTNRAGKDRQPDAPARPAGRSKADAASDKTNIRNESQPKAGQAATGNDSAAQGAAETAQSVADQKDTSTSLAEVIPPFRFSAFAPLPVLLRPLAPWRPRLPKIDLPQPPVATQIDPVHDRRFSLEASVFGSGYLPASTSQSFGAGAGLTAGWRVKKSLAVRAGVQWRQRAMREFAAGWGEENTNQLRYSFGFEREEYTLEGRWSHWLETPVSVQWRKAPWRAEAGIAPGFLLGVQGRVTHVRETSLDGRSTDRQSVQLDDAPFFRTYVAVFAGGQYDLTNRLGLGLRLHYLGGDFRRPTDSYDPPRQTLWVDAGLRWRLF